MVSIKHHRLKGSRPKVPETPPTRFTHLNTHEFPEMSQSQLGRVRVIFDVRTSIAAPKRCEITHSRVSDEVSLSGQQKV